MLTKKEAQWLAQHYPDLSINEDYSEIRGTLLFKATYNKETNEFRIAGDSNDNQGGVFITDSYEIIMRCRSPQSMTATTSKLPALFIKEENLDFFVPARHFNNDQSACYCGPVEEEIYFKKGYQFKTFFIEFVIPFLYEQSYFDQNEEWPWGEYGHGWIGVLESYYRLGKPDHIPRMLEKLKEYEPRNLISNFLESKSNLKGHSLCICGSNQVVRKCHKEAWLGLNKLRSEMKKPISK
ncbi:MAG: hypothetical protein IPI46_14300 [Bacteroidetes bacterium]|nr:hypothetical protein [Bacteroidota bacterium]